MSVSRSTVSNLLQRQVQRWKFGKDFVRYLAIEDGKWTLDEFQKLSSEHAVGLLDAKFRRGDLAVLDLNGDELESVVSFFALATAGVKVGFLSSQSGADVKAVLQKSGARGALVARNRVGHYYAAIPRLEFAAYGAPYSFGEFPALKMLIQTGRDPLPGFYGYEALYVSDPMPDPLAKLDISPDDVAAVVFGQDGQTVASYSHNSLVEAGGALADALSLSFQDRIFVGVPLNSISGITAGIFPCLTGASEAIIPGPRKQSAHSQYEEADLSAKRVWATLEEEQATGIIGEVRLLDALSQKQLSAKAASQISKIAIVAGSSDLKAAADLQRRLPSVFPELRSVVTAAVDPRSAAGPLFFVNDKKVQSARGVSHQIDSKGRVTIVPGVTTPLGVKNAIDTGISVSAFQ